MLEIHLKNALKKTLKKALKKSLKKALKKAYKDHKDFKYSTVCGWAKCRLAPF